MVTIQHHNIWLTSCCHALLQVRWRRLAVMCALPIALHTASCGSPPIVIRKPECQSANRVLVPAANYQLGCESRRLCESNPLHTAALESFRIDSRKVLRSEYAECVSASKCPRHYVPDTHDTTQAASVRLEAAHAYCKWKGGNLPTPDQWEASGRGNTGVLYPWGDSWRENMRAAPTLFVLQYYRGNPHEFIYYRSSCPNLTQPSVFGVHDLSGNGPEFVLSEKGEVRGGSYDSDSGDDASLVVRSFVRYGQLATFRCVYPSH
jgi:formylglycine-generating enzyme required for sulfatase activity